jgi:hypothetical protein
MITTFKEYPEVPVPEWLQALGTDGSWHNDAMPHAWIWVDEAAFRGVEVWVNFDKEEDREIGGKWEVMLMESEDQYHNQNGTVLYQGEDEAAAIAGVNHGLARLGSPLRIGGPIAGVWTPWAQVLCRKCHDSLGSEVTAKRKVEWPADEKGKGDGQGICSECGCECWVRADVAQLSRVRALVGGELEQTGGMCAALTLKREDGGAVVMTVDGPITIGRFKPGEWEDCAEAEQYYCIPASTPDYVAALIVTAVIEEKTEETK